MQCATAEVASFAVLCACLAACGTAPPAVAPTPEPPQGLPTRADDSFPVFEQKLLARAAAFERQGHFAEAAFAWQALVLLRSEHRERFAELNKRIEALAAERLERARHAQAMGDPATAEEVYLTVLALQPDHAEAAASLRSIERARTKRYLGQPSRIGLSRRLSTNPNSQPAAPASTPSDSLELEHVSLLAGQGEIDHAIRMLERRMARQPLDDAARRQLAAQHFRRAQTLQTSDPSAARAALAICLRLEPGHAEAAVLLKQLTPPTTKPPAARAKTATREEDPR